MLQIRGLKRSYLLHQLAPFAIVFQKKMVVAESRMVAREGARASCPSRYRAGETPALPLPFDLIHYQKDLDSQREDGRSRMEDRSVTRCSAILHPQSRSVYIPSD